jgi:hypothetical protein
MTIDMEKAVLSQVKTEYGDCSAGFDGDISRSGHISMRKPSCYAVNYIGLVPILVEAIKEQQVQIEALQEASQRKPEISY